MPSQIRNLTEKINSITDDSILAIQEDTNPYECKKVKWSLVKRLIDTFLLGPLTGVGAAIISLTERMGVVESDVSGVVGDITSLDGRLDTAEGDITSLEGDINSVFTASELGRNCIINGNFDIWQRGTIGVIGSGYRADRWKLGSSSGATIGHNRGTFNPNETAPIGSKHYMQIQLASATANSYTLLEQFVEDWLIFNNKAVTIQFWAKKYAVINGASVSINIFPNNSVSEIAGPSVNLALTDSWAKYTINYTVPHYNSTTALGANNAMKLIFAINTDVDTLFEIANVQLCLGTFNDLPEHRRPMALETELCYRYYEQSNPPSVKIEEAKIADSSQNMLTTIHCSVPKRVTGTPTFIGATGTVGVITNKSFGYDTVTNGYGTTLTFHTAYINCVGRLTPDAGYGAASIQYSWTWDAEY